MFMKKMMIDYMKEVNQIGNRIIDSRKELTKPFISKLKNVKFREILLVASGSSSNIARNAKYFIEKIVSVPVNVISPATFQLYHASLVQEDSLVVLLSQGGYSTNAISAAEAAKKTKGTVIGFCNYLDSPMARLLKDVYSYGNEPGDYFVAKGFTISTLSLMIHFLEYALSKDAVTKEDYEEYIVQFRKSLDKYDELIEKTEAFYLNHVQLCQEINRVLMIGQGPTFADAMEGKLKFTETYGASANEYELEEFLHGPDYAVNKDTTVLLICPKNGKSYERFKEVYENLPTLTNRIIFITTDTSLNGEGIIDVDDEGIDETISCLFLIAPMQFIADRICLDLRVSAETLSVYNFGQNVAFKANDWQGKF